MFRSIRDVEHLLLTDPAKYNALLSAYFDLLGTMVVDAVDAIERAEAGQMPKLEGINLDGPEFATAFRRAMLEVRNARAKRDNLRHVYDRRAAALLALSRLTAPLERVA